MPQAETRETSTQLLIGALTTNAKGCHFRRISTKVFDGLIESHQSIFSS